MTATSEMAEPRPTVVALVGPRGAGKTTLGVALAVRLQWPFRDGDALLAAAAGEDAGSHLERVGEPAFRDLEQSVTLAALQTAGVVALGGGAVLAAAVRERLQQDDVLTVALDAPSAALVERIRRSTSKRPPLTALPLDREVHTVRQRRHSLYEQVADLWLETGGANVDSCCRAILARMHGVR